MLMRTQCRRSDIVSSCEDAIIGEDLNGTITSWDHSADRSFGYTAKEAIGQSISLIVPSERLQEEEDVGARIRAGQSVDHYETIRRTKNGRLVQIGLTVSPAKASAGTAIRAS